MGGKVRKGGSPGKQTRFEELRLSVAACSWKRPPTVRKTKLDFFGRGKYSVAVFFVAFWTYMLFASHLISCPDPQRRGAPPQSTLGG
jgi:hypothetical protein